MQRRASALGRGVAPVTRQQAVSPVPPGVSAAVETRPGIPCRRHRAVIIRAACPHANIARIDGERGFVLHPAIGSATQQNGVCVCATSELISANIRAALVDGDAHVYASRRGESHRHACDDEYA